MGGKGFRKGKGRPKGGGKGRRKGGKGKGKSRLGGKGKGLRRPASSGILFGHRPPAYAGAPPPLPEDPSAPFLHPASRPLVKVPLEFASLRHWCEVIGNNILAEFYHMFREARSVFSGFGTAAGDELIIDGAPPDGFSQHLLLVDRQPRLVSSQRLLGVGRVALKLRGGSARSGSVRSLGYVGSYLAEYSACLELRTMPPRELTPPMCAILEPKVDVPGDYARRCINTALVPVNPSQRAAIEGLRHALEKIQGPPGTGKSTTIFHILDARIPPGQRVLVTCSRNVAVESIAQKLEGLEGWPLCVFGPKDRVGETARRYLLDSQVGGHVDERKVGRVAAVVAERGALVRDALKSREALFAGRRGERLWRAYLRHRYRLAYALAEICSRLGKYCALAAKSPEWCKERTQLGKQCVLSEVRVFLCTIASTSRMLREWEEATGEDLRVHTVIVDECGCTPESSTALLLRLRPSNLIMVGDHKQLPPCSVVAPQLLEGTNHTRSLLERCVLASGSVHQLREQYRMHASIAGLVSSLFYAGRLFTPSAVADARKACEPRPLVWLDVNGWEEAPMGSYMNASEVSACTRVCTRLRERVPAHRTVALLTFYRGQLDQLMHALPADLGIEVLTVDACQGSEFDYVVLSTVRSNREQRLGFVKDPQRINVAISRSRMQLFVVGSRATMSADADWNRVQQACSPAMPEDTQPRRAERAPGSFVSVFDALTKQKEKEAAQRAKDALEEQQDGRGKGRGGCKGKGGSASTFSAEALMWQQSSFMFRPSQGTGRSGGIQRRNDGTYTTNSAVAIGGGFRRRVDVAEIEAIVAHHKASLEPSVGRFASKYSAPQTGEEFEAAFPDLGASAIDAAAGPAAPALARISRAAGSHLRPATRNDEKRARRAAQRAAASAAALETVEAVEQEDEDEFEAAAFADDDDGVVWEDVDEVVLFEMFPDDADAVEEALRRFAGLKHQAARALEALLARPSAAAGKAILDAEDELDYDRAPAEDEEFFDQEDPEEEYAITEFGEGEAEEEGDDPGEQWWEPGCCAGCGAEAPDAEEEDGVPYCVRCWTEWAVTEVSSSAYEGFGSSRPAPPPIPTGSQQLRGLTGTSGEAWRNAVGDAAAATKADAAATGGGASGSGAAAGSGGGFRGFWDDGPTPSSGSRAAPGATAKTLGDRVGDSSTAGAAAGAVALSAASSAARTQGGRRVERVAFFDGLDGAPKWSEAPKRPEAGGKELITLKPKHERGDDEDGPGASVRRRWGRASAAAAVSIPAAAMAPAVIAVRETRAERCRRLLAGLEPAPEASTADYIASLVEAEEDLDEARDISIEMLEGHGVDRAAAEAFWAALMSP